MPLAAAEDAIFKRDDFRSESRNFIFQWTLTKESNRFILFSLHNYATDLQDIYILKTHGKVIMIAYIGHWTVF